MNKAKNIPICASLFVVLQGVGLLIYACNSYFDLPWFLDSILMMAVAILLATTYKSHAKNVMKPLIGAALMLMTEYEIGWAAEYLQYFDYYVEYASKTYVIINTALQIVLALAILLISVNHLIINFKHESNEKLVRTNKVLYIIFVVVVIGQLVISISGALETYDIIATICATISDVFLIAEVIIIEGLVDNFRAEREEVNAHVES